MKLNALLLSLIHFFSVCICTGVPLRSTALEDSPFFSGQVVERSNLVALAGYGEERLSSVLVMGSIHCNNPCQAGTVEHASGAVVAVRCWRGNTRTNTKGIADEFGDFTVELPSEIHAWPKIEKSCRVRVLGVPQNSTCFPKFTRKPTRFRLSSVGNGVRAFDAGEIWIKKDLGPKIACV